MLLSQRLSAGRCSSSGGVSGSSGVSGRRSSSSQAAICSSSSGSTTTTTLRQHHQQRQQQQRRQRTPVAVRAAPPDGAAAAAAAGSVASTSSPSPPLANGASPAAAAATAKPPQMQPSQPPPAVVGGGAVELPEVRGPRSATVTRATKETRVEVRVDLDGTGRCVANTPVGFFNHMLDQLASHGLFDVYVNAAGDTWIDDHHTVEDVALALGAAFSQALGDRSGIHRFGEFTAPLDEALTHVVLDLSGRAHLSFDLVIPAQRIGSFDTELVEHFFSSWAATSGTTLHVRQLAGKNSHHIVEATFKAFARALRRAAEADPRRAGKVASSKGVLTQS